MSKARECADEICDWIENGAHPEEQALSEGLLCIIEKHFPDGNLPLGVKSVSDEFIEAWNQLGAPFAKVRHFNGARLQTLKLRMADAFWRANWKAALSAMRAIPFYCGESERGWVADVDFFLRPNSVVKLLERNDQQQMIAQPKKKTMPDAHTITINSERDAEARAELLRKRFGITEVPT